MVDRIQDLIVDPNPGPNIITQRPGLDQESFLQLLVAQLQNQNPLEPMSNFEFIGQIAQLSTLDQITALNATLSGFAEFTALGQLASMIGKEATIVDQASGLSVTGIITAVTFENGQPRVIINGGAYSLDLITRIGLPEEGVSETP